MRLGLHVGIRQGPLAALRRAEALGLEVLQMLSYRRRPGTGGDFRWEAPDPVEAAAFRAARAASAVGRLVIHVRYLPFLASSDAVRREASVDLLERELRFAALLGGDELILHLGAFSPGSSAVEGTRLFADGVAQAWARAGGGPRLVIENVPGGGRRMGGSLEEVAELRLQLAGRGLDCAVCLDTAHAWAAGYDMASAAGMDDFLNRAAAAFGAAAVMAFHLNDSRAERGSHREHHEHWGEGLLGGEGLGCLLRRRDFSHASGVLETPPGKDETNLDYVRARLPT